MSPRKGTVKWKVVYVITPSRCHISSVKNVFVASKEVAWKKVLHVTGSHMTGSDISHSHTVSPRPLSTLLTLITVQCFIPQLHTSDLIFLELNFVSDSCFLTGRCPNGSRDPTPDIPIYCPRPVGPQRTELEHNSHLVWNKMQNTSRSWYSTVLT